MGGYKIPRLSVEKSDKNIREQLEKSENDEKESNGKMQNLRLRVIASARLSTNNNQNLVSRKRLSGDMAQSDAKTPKLAEKRAKLSENLTSTPQGDQQDPPPL